MAQTESKDRPEGDDKDIKIFKTQLKNAKKQNSQNTMSQDKFNQQISEIKEQHESEVQDLKNQLKSQAEKN